MRILVYLSGIRDIVCPDKLEDIFTLPVQTNPALNLNMSLRTHTAGEVSNFVNAFIDGEGRWALMPRLPRLLRVALICITQEI